jgi:hypothetical protein
MKKNNTRNHNWKPLLEKGEFGILWCDNCGLMIKWEWNYYDREIKYELMRIK